MYTVNFSIHVDYLSGPDASTPKEAIQKFLATPIGQLIEEGVRARTDGSWEGMCVETEAFQTEDEDETEVVVPDGPSDDGQNIPF